MFLFIFRRILQSILMIFIMSFFCYFLMNLMPGDPIDQMLASNPKMTSEDADRLRKLYGVDQPLTVRYSHWIQDILHGDLGYSRTYRIPVTEILGPRLLNSMILALSSLMFSLLIAIPIGVFTALKQGSKWDHFVNLFAFAGISMPSFWLGILLILIFSVGLKILPAGGTSSIDSTDLNGWSMILDRCKYLILPTLSLSVMQIGRFSRFVRSSMIDSMNHDYIRTAKAKGLADFQILWRHGFRNALIPVITVVALSMGGIFSGALITETLFSYQGAGKLVYESILGNDYNVAMISLLVSVTMVLLMSLIADLLYAWVDPRISLK